MELRRHVGLGQPHVLHHGLGHVDVQRVIHQQRHRAALHGLRSKLVRVHGQARRADEQVARLHLAGIPADVAYLYILISDYPNLAGNAPGQFIQLHSASPCNQFQALRRVTAVQS